MKYRHSFHAGNFADVHKHVTLLALIHALERKDKGFLYIDTHAGRGQYDLASAPALRGAESRLGVQALRTAPPEDPEVRDYLDALELANAGARTSAGGPAPFYPGSPLLAAQRLRAQDRGVCCEIQPPECRALQRALQAYPRLQALCSDGLAAISAYLPPVEKRALVLIDPPYEDSAADFDRALRAALSALARLSNAVIALWYPIKDERDLSPWMARAAALLSAPAANNPSATHPTLNSQLWLYPRDSRVALNGSGLLIVNPPYQFDAALRRWLPKVCAVLAAAAEADSSAGTAVEWLVSA